METMSTPLAILRLIINTLCLTLLLVELKVSARAYLKVLLLFGGVSTWPSPKPSADEDPSICV